MCSFSFVEHTHECNERLYVQWETELAQAHKSCVKIIFKERKVLSMKKRALALTMATAMVLTTACSGGGGSQADTTAAPAADTTAAGSEADSGEAASGAETSGEPVTIKVANYALLEAGYDTFWEGVKTGFEAEYPNVTIEWVTAPYGEILNQVINMAGGGDRVDCIFSEMIWIPSLVDAGLATPLDGVLDEEFLNDYYPNVLEAHSVDGQVYGAPLYVSPFVLFYNKDLFEKAGLDPENPPTTYEEMLEIAPKLAALTTEDGNKVYAFGQPTASVAVVGSSLQSFAMNFGGTIFDENNQFNVDNQGFVDAMNMLQDLDELGYNPQNTKPKDLRNLFALGQLAMYYDNTWGFNGVTSINPEAENFAATAMPLSGGSGNGEVTLQSHCFVAVDNGEAQLEAVKNFIQYVISPEVLEDYLANIAPAYAAKGAMENMDAIVNNEFLKGGQGAIETAVPVYQFPTLNDFNLELCALGQAVTVGKEDVATAIEGFKGSVQSILP